MGGTWENVPKCADCPCLVREKTLKGKRARRLRCIHVEAKEAYQSYHGWPWPELGLGVPLGELQTGSDNLPFKTSPRWCPLKPRWWARYAGGDDDSQGT